MFDLKQPCLECPFRFGAGERYRLSAERLDEIANAPAFQCHKTIDYSEHEDRTASQCANHAQQCAGLMAILHRENRPNQIMQVATRLGFLDPDALDPKSVVYISLADALSAHRE